MKTNKGSVSIISRESNDKTLDVAMLESELRSRGLNVRVMSRLLTKEKSLKALGYAGHVMKQEAAILASDVVVIDTYCIPASMIPHRKGTKVIQMWHALGAIKKFGWQTVGKKGGSSERTARIMKMHKGYDYVVSPSDITAEHFCKAFRAARDKVVKCGLPRIDYIKSVASGELHDEMRARILSHYPQLNSNGNSDKKTILYAPTFRRGKSVDVEGLLDALDPDKYNVVVKLHPLYRVSEIGSTRGEKVPYTIYDDDFSSYDWLAAADIVISDYSSFVIEASLTDKPLYIYAYDLEEYSEDTGLNIDFESEPISGYVFKKATELASTLDKSEYDMGSLRAFRDRYIDIDTSHCTADLADFIESQITRRKEK